MNCIDSHLQPVIPEDDCQQCETDAEALHTALQSNTLLDKKGFRGVKLFSLILVSFHCWCLFPSWYKT